MICVMEWEQGLANLIEPHEHAGDLRECAEYVAQSVAAFRAALEVFTREQLPQQWAMTQNNLGAVLRDLGERASEEQRAQYLRQSVEAIENALSIFTPEAAPYQNSLARDNLEKTNAALRKVSSP